MEQLTIKCKGCGHDWPVRLDPRLQINPKKLKINACFLCPLKVRKREFPKIKDHKMKKQKIKVKKIPNYYVTVEIKQVKSKRYK